MTTTTDCAGKPRTRLTSGQECALFFKRFLTKGAQVASFVPSSKSLARAAARGVDGSKRQVILELGAGTGAITTEIMARKHPESRVVSIQMDPMFVPVLRRACPGAEVIEADVISLPAVLEKLGVTDVDVLVNGLPTPSLPAHVNEVILETVEGLAGQGRGLVVSQLTVMPLVYMKMYKAVWESVSFEWVVANVPPAGVYHLQSLKPSWRQAIPGKRATEKKGVQKAG